MNNKLKRYYEKMNLPYNATIEEVENKKQILIKMYSSQKNEEKKLQKLEDMTNFIIVNIKENGIPKIKEHQFNVSWQSIFTSILVLFCVAVLCYLSFYIFK